MLAFPCCFSTPVVRTAIALLWLIPLVAHGQGAARANPAIQEDTPPSAARAQGEGAYQLAERLGSERLWISALDYYAEVLKGGKGGPQYLRAVAALVDLQQRLNDQYLIPNLLALSFDSSWNALPPESIARVNYWVANVQLRRGNLDRAQTLLSAIPAADPIYPKARYLIGVVLSDPRYPGGPRYAEALATFEAVARVAPKGQPDLQNIQELARLGIARIHYGLRQYAKAVAAYDSVPRFSRYWNQSLFENGFARFQNEDPGGALGSLQSLHAPQFSGAFEPESWILKATLYYFNCLYEESRGSLKEFEEIYLPIWGALLPWAESKGLSVLEYFQAISLPDPRIPRPVLLWIRNHERLMGVFELLRQIDREKAAIERSSAWKGNPLEAELLASLEQNADTVRQIAGQFAKNRILEASQNIKTFSDQAEIIRFEIVKAEKELAEMGVDQRKIFESQTLYRPAMPAEDWNYWKFQGEFWIDEIGYYQYTLKRGCPAEGRE